MDQFITAVPTALSPTYLATFSQLSLFLPRILVAIAIGFLGVIIARWLRHAVIKSLEMLQLNSVFKNTPVESFLQESSFPKRIEQVVGGVVYWLFILLVFYTTVSVLGLSSLTFVLERVLAYIPKIFSAVVIIFLGVFVAGILEGVVKGSIKTIGGRQSRLIGKVASYLTLVMFALAAVSELGIAQQFITILFIGFVTTATLTISLAFGLGSKEVVAKMMDDWYTKFAKDTKESDSSAS